MACTCFLFRASYLEIHVLKHELGTPALFAFLQSRTMASMIFSDEEARFLRLVLKLAERPHDDKRASWMPHGQHVPEKVKAAGEFRILVIGGQGVGKTSLLAKVNKSLCPPKKKKKKDTLWTKHGNSYARARSPIRPRCRLQATSMAAGTPSTSSRALTPSTRSSCPQTTSPRPSISARP